MRLTVFNGSPRARKGNTTLLLEHFRSGFEEVPGNVWELHHLVSPRQAEENAGRFAGAECVLIVFPLYVDAMPSQVLGFFEALGRAGPSSGPPVLFLVHSGFPEALQSRFVERYLEKLARRLGSRYLGTMVKGGSEGIRVMPAWMTRKLFRTMRELGRSFGETGALDPVLVKALAGRERYGALSRLLIRFIAVFGLTNAYWDQQLKKNDVFDRRYARPYEP